MSDMFTVLEVIKNYCQSRPSLLLAVIIICFITASILLNYIKLKDREIKAVEVNKAKTTPNTEMKTSVCVNKTE